MPVVIDLFAGAGGLSLGACRAGFNVRAAVEKDEHAMASHATNVPYTAHIQQDIMSLSGADILRLSNIDNNDLIGIIGGPPCQGFSSIGQGDVNDIRNRLFIKFFEIVEELRPVFFLAENVPGIMNEKYDSIRQEAFNHLQEYTLLDPIRIVASDYGAPTTRTRIFFIGYRNDPRISPFTKDDIESQKVPKSQQTIVKQALEGLPDSIIYRDNAPHTRKITKAYLEDKRTQSSFFYERVTGVIPQGVGNQVYIKTYQEKHLVNGCIPTKHSDVVQQRYASLGYGKQDKVSKSTKLKPDGFCPTLRAGTGPDKGSYQAVRPIHYKHARVITPREAARLQGFPDWYQLPETIWHGFRQIGNSVSPIAAEQVLSAIYQKLTL